MRKGILAGFGLIFAVGALAEVLPTPQWRPSAAFAEAPDFLRGCEDVPEAIALMDTYKDRLVQMQRYGDTLARREAEIEAQRAELTAVLVRLQAVKDAAPNRRNDHEAVRADIDRLVSVYDAMKPDEAARVLTNLPADFAAEILMRVRPETGARIVAAVEPRQAAILTTHMGARHLAKR